MTRLLGWAAVGISLVVACVWAYWGIIENFHEGWCAKTLAGNLVMSAKFLGPMLVTLALGSGAIRFPRAFGLAHAFLGIAVVLWWMCQRWPVTPVFLLDIFTLSGFLVAGVGAMYYFGRPTPSKWAYAVLLIPPLIIVAAGSIEPAWRIAHRVDDGILSARIVDANGVRLLWAPEGPGWPQTGCDWFEAQRRCQYLSGDGSRLDDEKHDFWRLPTTAEVVASLTRTGVNAGGTWDPTAQRAKYRIRPDKESPLWIPTSRIIYFWTADEVDADFARFVAANGYVGKRPKRLGMGSHAFRAVRETPAAEASGPQEP
ncbi:MAG TPA: hypothetical protein PLM14_02805 [Candidatus Hydrogenedentes bacterium]|nr:hypothetical protein [Candidatus Hydrogenedentota bacterium]HQH52301.1 hypothetical protein [Candidatus Hydrogenedentota bacterium]